MAQLVARFHGMEEVRGSNPLSSTISATILRISVIVALFFYCRNVRVNTRVNTRVNIRVLNESRVLRKRASENLLPV